MNTKHTSLTPTQTAAQDLGTCGSNATVEAKESQQTGHTPGPWFYDGTSNVRSNGPDSPNAAIAYDPRDHAHITEVTRANARLIAAAPDLLEACKMLLNRCELEGVEWIDMTEARAAIAKAEGKQNE